MIESVQTTEIQPVDVLFCREDQSYHLFQHPVIYTENAHGTGCTLSSAIAAHLAKGFSMVEAVRLGVDFVYGALQNSRFLQIGKGRQGIMNHMYRHYTYE